MVEKAYLKLRPSEQAVFAAASRLYSGYLASGAVTDENREEMLSRSVREAVTLARLADDAVASDGEMG